MEGGTALHLQDASPCCTTPLPTTLPRPSTTRWEVLSHSWFAFFFVGWLLQMDESLTVGLHRPVVVAQLGKPRHSRWPVTPPQLSDTTGKAASLSVVRHTATVVSGTTGKAGSLPVVSHTATVVKHNWESCGLMHPSGATVHTKAIDKHHVGWPGADSTLQTSLWTMVNSCKLQKSDAAAPCFVCCSCSLCSRLVASGATVHTEATDKGTTSSHVGWLGAGSTLQTSLWMMVNSRMVMLLHAV